MNLHRINRLIINSLVVCVACSQSDANRQEGSMAPNDPARLNGAWELVENRVDGKLIEPKRSQQFKTFQDGFFSFIMYNPDGSFHGAGAGPYTLNGNQYRETFRYYSDTTWVGYANEQTWELRGDTLIFSGFKKVFDRTGKEMPSNAWGGDKFVEKRVRARP